MNGKIKIGDVIVISVTLLCALCIFAVFNLGVFTGDAEVLTVEYGDEIKSYSLSKDTDIEIVSRGYTLLISISGGKARVSQADCPDRTCLNSGEISKNGESIVCVPSGVVLRISGEGENGYDAIAG